MNPVGYIVCNLRVHIKEEVNRLAFRGKFCKECADILHLNGSKRIRVCVVNLQIYSVQGRP